MIIGNGDIASVLPDREDLLFFASGVSNSQEERESEYKRERDLLLKQDNISKHIVYFSSLAVFYGNTRYTDHKKEMEALVKRHFIRYTIIRIGNITWGDNPHTLLNYLRNCISQGKPFQVKDEYRYIIDQDEFLHWINMIPSWDCEINIPGRRMKVADIVAMLNIEAKYDPKLAQI